MKQKEGSQEKRTERQERVRKESKRKSGTGGLAQTGIWREEEDELGGGDEGGQRTGDSQGFWGRLLGGKGAQLTESREASLGAQRVKQPPAAAPSLGREDAPEKGMAPHSSVLAWRWTEEPGGLQSVGSQRVGHDWATDTFTS